MTVNIERVSAGPVPEAATQVHVPMRDGVLLAADVYTPDGLDSMPTILVRLPYDKDGDYCFMPEWAAYATSHGYAMVVQDIRGKFRSEGETRGFIHEVDDGYDTIDWIASQRWSDGSIVMLGDSYYGMTQLAAATSGHPALKAIAPRMTGTQLGGTVTYEDGSTDVEQTAMRAYAASVLVSRDMYWWPIDWSRRPLADTFEDFFAALGSRSAEYDASVAAGGSGSISIEELLAAPPVPTLFTIGWSDNCAIWSWPDVDRLRADEAWGPHVRLRLEGMDHEMNRYSRGPATSAVRRTAAQRLEVIRDAMVPTLDFFDSVLGRRSVDVPSVVFEISNGEWGSAATWPPPSSSPAVLYLGAGSPHTLGTLSSQPADEGLIEWRSDGNDLVPSVAPDQFALLADVRDLAEHSLRPDVASVETEPLAESLTLAGPIDLFADVTSSASSTDVFARLLDIDRDGRATLIARGQSRISTGDGAADVRVRMLHAGYRVHVGHRLRLHLASSDYPEFTFNPGDGSDPWTSAGPAAVSVSVAAGGDRGARLTYWRMSPAQA